MTNRIKAGIIGGAGYTAGELIRILLRHPGVEIAFVQSSSHAGQPVAVVHEDMEGGIPMVFTGEPDLDAADALFLCMGHGNSRAWLESHPIPAHLKIIDLSSDYRIHCFDNPFVYGLPELNREAIRKARFIANPGCFATGILLALLPLAAAGLLRDEIHVHAITGSTGAGQQATSTTHFSWRESNLSAYKIFEHQHQEEIMQSLLQLQPGYCNDFNLVPLRGNHTRGIFATAYTAFGGNTEEARQLYEAYYCTHPFVVIPGKNPSLKQVVNTNKALLYPLVANGRLIIVSCTDNLLKGASGQAVQNLNLMVGLEETAGLDLKPVVF